MTEDKKNNCNEQEDSGLHAEDQSSIESYLDSALTDPDSDADDAAIQKRLKELEEELKLENSEEPQQSGETEALNEALQTRVAEEGDNLSSTEIETKLEQAKPSGVDYHQRQASQPSALEAISASDLALEDDIDETEEEECLNCSAPLKGPYCHNCGQPDRHFIRFFPKVLWDMINEAFDFDSRAFRTLLPLMFLPGRLSMEYIAGRRARYVNPLRLYIFLSVIFFISISLFTDTNNGIKVNSSDGVNSRSRVISETSVAESIDKQKSVLSSLKEKQAQGFPVSDEAIAEVDAAIIELEKPSSEQDNKSSGLDREDGEFDIKLENGKLWNIETNPILFNDWFSEETTKELNIFLMSLVEKFDKAIKEDSSDLVEEFLNAIPQLMFILLPLFALILKVTYIFKKRYYMEHLIVALHSHCFIFFSLLLIILMSALSETLTDPPWLIQTLEILVIVLAIWIPLNIYITQKKIYAQGYILTTLKFVFVGVVYWALLTVTAGMAFVVGLVNM